MIEILLRVAAWSAVLLFVWAARHLGEMASEFDRYGRPDDAVKIRWVFYTVACAAVAIGRLAP